VIVPYESGNASGRFGPPSLVFGFPDQARALGRRMLVIAQAATRRPVSARVAVVGPDLRPSEPSRSGMIWRAAWEFRLRSLA